MLLEYLSAHYRISTYEFELPFYRLVEPTKSANYSTSTYVALPVLRVARIPVSTLSHIHVRPVLNIDIQRMLLGTFAPKSAEGAVCFELQNTTICETNRHIQAWFAAVRRGARIDASNFAQRPTNRNCEIVTVSLQLNHLYSSVNPEVLVIFKFPSHCLTYVLIDAQDTLSSIQRYSSCEIVTVSLQ